MSLNTQNGVPKCQIAIPTARSLPLNSGPSEETRQPKDATAPLILASASLEGAMFVILRYTVNKTQEDFKL